MRRDRQIRTVGSYEDAGRQMSELRATTEPGAVMVRAAERFALEFADGAMDRDRSSTFASEHLDKLRVDRFLVAPLPADVGGGGVESIHDLLVASSRLARGDASTTLGVNMHLAIAVNIVRARDVTRARGEDPAPLTRLLRRVVDEDIVFSSAVSEPSPQDLTRPRTTARPTDDGWVIDGRKMFCTMAPAATFVNTAVTYEAPDGTERCAFVLVPSTAPGVIFNDDWDAVGMRASASGSMTLREVSVSADALRDAFAAGEYSTTFFDRFLPSGAFHAASALGVAESAHLRIVTTLASRADATASDPHAAMNLAENLVDLTAMQASLDLAGRRIDEYFGTYPDGRAPVKVAQAVTADVQAAKAFICAGTQRVTDRALALSGGAGYMAAHPLAKAWRDGRAGAFMHPFGANRAYDIVARTALGLELRPEPGAERR